MRSGRVGQLHRPDQIAYWSMHIAALSALWITPNWADVALGIALYLLRAMGISIGWHRYLSHGAFSTSRAVQFSLVLLGSLSGMKGGLWFAAHHQHHHRIADQPGDRHSPVVHGFLYAHSGWFLDKSYRRTDYEKVRRWTRYPELVWLNENGLLLSTGLAGLVWLAGGTSALIWGYLLSTLLVWHSFHAVGSLGHSYGGYRRFATPDNSRNRPLLALIAFGEGYHNNHHFAPCSARMGLTCWEPDPGWWFLCVCARFGLVWDLKDVRDRIAQAPQSVAGGAP